MIIVIAKYNKHVIKKLQKQYDIKERIYWFVKSGKQRKKNNIKFITTHPAAVREFVYLLLSYLLIMYGYRKKVIIYSDSFADIQLLNYHDNFEVYFITPIKYKFKLLHKQCGFVPFDPKGIDYDKLCKACEELIVSEE